MHTLSLVEEYISSRDWQFNKIKDLNAISFGLAGNGGKFQCFVAIDEAEAAIQLYSIGGANVPPEKRQGMAELITRINYELKVGNFEMDFNDGEFRFKTSIRFPAGEATSGLVSYLFQSNIAVMDKALPLLMKFIYSDSTPEEIAIEFLPQR